MGHLGLPQLVPSEIRGDALRERFEARGPTRQRDEDIARHLADMNWRKRLAALVELVSHVARA